MPYARHAVRDGHGSQAGAILESFIFYARHAVRDSHRSQAVALREFVSNCNTDNCDLNGRKVMMSFLLMARKWDI